jgi:hypothetical protein
MRKLLVGIFLLSTLPSFSQILQDAQAKALISQGLDHLYAYEFKESMDDFNAVKAKYPKNPAGYLLSAMQFEKQYFPLKDHPAQSRAYLAFLELTYQLASEAYERNPNDQEAVFFCISSLGFLAAYENDYQNYVKAVNYTRKAYSHLKIGLRNTERQPEFLYSAGIYNYYRIVYPELHSVIRPFMVFFEDGNKRLGISQLEAAIRRSVFVKNESTFYLAYVYNKYEGTPSKGLPYSELLVNKYPDNHLFNLQRAELLTLAGQYDAADPFIQKLEKSKSPYMMGAAHVFRGMREEFERKRYTIAEAHYGKAMQHPWEERFTKDIHGLALMGIARIENRKGNKGKALNWARKAAEFVEYKNSIEEQKRLVNAYGK